MKITQKTIDQIEKMQKGGMEDSEIQELLNLTDSVQHTLTAFKQTQEGLLKANEVAQMLEKGLTKTHQKFNYDKVLRLAREGKLKTAQAHVGESGKLYKRGGVLFKKEDVEAFIANGLKTKDQLLNENHQLKETLAAVEKERDELRGKLEAQPKETPDFADLIAENSQKQGQIDVLTAKNSQLQAQIEVLKAKPDKQNPPEEKTKKDNQNENITPEIADAVSKEIILQNEKFQPIEDELKEAMHQALFKKRKSVKWFNGSYYKNPLKSSNKFHYVSAEGAMTAMLDELEERLEKKQG